MSPTVPRDLCPHHRPLNKLQDSQVLCGCSQGLIVGTPMGVKSAILRVTTVNPCAMAVAAMRASRSGRGSGTCRCAQHIATASSTGRILSWKEGMTWRLIQVRRSSPCKKSRRSIHVTPNSSSMSVIADR